MSDVVSFSGLLSISRSARNKYTHTLVVAVLNMRVDYCRRRDCVQPCSTRFFEHDNVE